MNTPPSVPQPSVRLAQKRASFAVLLDMWPDLAVIARDLGFPYSTVSTWHRRNVIPFAHWPVLAESAQARGLRGITVTRLRQIDAERRRRLVEARISAPIPAVAAP